MAKKNRQKLQQRLAKRQLVSQLTSGQPSLTDQLIVSPDQSIERRQPSGPQTESIPVSDKISGEIGRTALSVTLIVGLLLIVVIIDRRSALFSDWGDRLYSFLRLNS